MSYKTISPSKYVYIYHALCFYLSISFILNDKKPSAIPVVIFIGMILISLTIIFHKKIGPFPKINLKYQIMP
ncbi:hypothetical protein [Xenorhabdus innexi]|uniref:Uncharacterized protein n=1 Tax=Xenorhabdus innexi TaxID=290109 RepID=A0A2G0N1F5_9GAMM|nr:hypothetical protein [Xenorhabdus innexi]PHM28555.1 hypothetical protein Xinn_03817 [Xenorhabdus innexi]